ncbi:MAG TPA: hypothetical protein VK064_03245 [Wenzhouxiangella sp.]|nr:hypothetical protein [Wenzhouxiangella sp.]
MQPDSELTRLADLLDDAAAERKTLFYIDAADRLGLPGPRRIQRLARLLEALIEADFAAGRPVRAALVVSKAQPDLPAPGFFDCAARLGLFRPGESPQCLHERLLQGVFGNSDRG